VRVYERNNSADTRVCEEERGGAAPGVRAEIPLQLVEKTICDTDCLPVACGGPHTRAGGCALKKAVTPWRACAGAGSWQDL